ncbi:MAG: type 1 glutamine amidotransferase [Candidatus Eremiobacteraeota bacterium]|nr:type 1 glutamine amidotransferase [Candidatus Eremiobacteraeota bacterium]MBV8375158.1 type 1 glutamine amidotransferase [Candidatus Eremiobacteraeota bacterium]
MSQAQLPLQGLRVAILVDNGFEQVEMEKPRQALEQAGAKTFLISPQKEKVQAAKHDEKGDEFPVDVSIANADPAEYDALLVPGGVRSPDKLRTNNKAVLFVQAFNIAKKPMAVICHGPWMLVEAGSARGHKLTSWPSLRTDITNAGGEWVDEVVVRDGLIVTSRKPDDIPAFAKAMIELFASTRSGSAVQGSGHAALA